jgi:uncharacterized protein (DUF2249 family)
MKDVIIDVQQIPAQNRHAYIFDTFDSLESGDCITILNNHDPKPLLLQFNEGRPEQFTSEYLVNGPSEWKVKLTKKRKEGCCGCC